MKEGCDEIRVKSGSRGEQLSIERARSDGLKTQVTELYSEMIKVEELLLVSGSKEKAALEELNTLDAQQCSMAGDLHTLHSKIAGFQARLIEDVECGSWAFSTKLATSLSSLLTA